VRSVSLSCSDVMINLLPGCLPAWLHLALFLMIVSAGDLWLCVVSLCRHPAGRLLAGLS
jgi:hypothetical protein